MKIWLNGHFVNSDEAQVSIFDAGLQHGVGLFETMGASNKNVFRAEAHMRRLADSAKELRLTERLHIKPLLEAIKLTLDENKMDHARVRLTLTGGDLNLLQSRGESQSDPTILIVAQPPTEYPADFFAKGVVVMIADGRENRSNPLPAKKT